MREHTIKISDGGVLEFVYDDDLRNLQSIGQTTIRRVSEVEFDNEKGGWVADMRLSDSDDKLGPFQTREEALDAERRWLKEHRGV